MGKNPERPQKKKKQHRKACRALPAFAGGVTMKPFLLKLFFFSAVQLFSVAYHASALACGGVTATIAEEPKRLGARTEKGPGGVTLHVDKNGDVYVAAKEIRISSALAEAITKKYLERKFGRYDHLEFEAFSYDHGDLVYMYHARVPGLAYSVHVGPFRYASDHAHVHVSALTGDVYGPGCGLGSGIVDMKFDANKYPKELARKRLPYFHFNTNFIAREGKPPKIDGRIEKAEWEGAGRAVLHVGTDRAKITEYG